MPTLLISVTGNWLEAIVRPPRPSLMCTTDRPLLEGEEENGRRKLTSSLNGRTWSPTLVMSVTRSWFEALM